MNEEWKDIKGYEGKYQVSNLGRIKSLNYHRENKELILNIKPDKYGYLRTTLYKNGKGKPYTIHRLVALHFISNPNNYPIINHKDENKQNNKVDNLEWCTAKYNMNYGTRTQRSLNKFKGYKHTEEIRNKMSQNHADYTNSKNPASRKVLCVTTGKKFNCIKEAIDFYHLKLSTKSSITMCCQGKYKSAGKHPDTGEKLVWKYID